MFQFQLIISRRSPVAGSALEGCCEIFLMNQFALVRFSVGGYRIKGLLRVSTSHSRQQLNSLHILQAPDPSIQLPHSFSRELSWDEKSSSVPNLKVYIDQAEMYPFSTILILFIIPPSRWLTVIFFPVSQSIKNTSNIVCQKAQAGNITNKNKNTSLALNLQYKQQKETLSRVSK